MGYKISIFILIISVLSIGCSAVNFSNQPNYSERDYRLFNKLGSQYSSTIYFLNGDTIKTNYLFAKQDSVLHLSNNDTLSIPQTDIEKIEINMFGKKIANGLFYGALSYAFFFLGGALAVSGDAFAMSFLVLPTSAILGIAGATLGYFYGDEKTYIFNNKSNYEQIEYYKRYHERKAERDSTNMGS